MLLKSCIVRLVKRLKKNMRKIERNLNEIRNKKFVILKMAKSCGITWKIQMIASR